MSNQNPNTIEIKISFDGKRVQVNGPMSNKLVVFGLLEMAKMVVAGDMQIQSLPPTPDLALAKPNGGAN